MIYRYLVRYALAHMVWFFARLSRSSHAPIEIKQRFAMKRNEKEKK